MCIEEGALLGRPTILLADEEWALLVASLVSMQWWWSGLLKAGTYSAGGTPLSTEAGPKVERCSSYTRPATSVGPKEDSEDSSGTSGLDEASPLETPPQVDKSATARLCARMGCGPREGSSQIAAGERAVWEPAVRALAAKERHLGEAWVWVCRAEKADKARPPQPGRHSLSPQGPRDDP